MSSDPAGAPRSHDERKYRRPRTRDRVLRRPRLDERFAKLLDEFEMLEVVAGAGYGKTLQTLSYAEAAEHQYVAWLTLDNGDRSPANLLHSLAAAVAGGRPAGRSDVTEVLRDAQRADVTDGEVGALLAAAVDGDGCLIVVDECEHLDGAGSALEVLDIFLENLSGDIRVILVSRNEIPWPLQRYRIEGRLGFLPDDELLMTVEEAAALVAEEKGAVSEADRAHELSGGWPVAIAMAARYGIPELDTTRNLSAYIDNHVLGGIPEDALKFLMVIAVIGTVSRDAAAAVYGIDAHRLWAEAVSHPLPGLVVTDDEIICRSLVRSHLIERLLRTNPAEKPAILTRYAEHLEERGDHTSATKTWLELNELDRAAASAAEAVGGLCERGDWVTVLDWIGELTEGRVLDRPALIASWIRSLHGDRQFDEAERLVVRLDQAGRLGEVLQYQRALLAIIALAVQGNPDYAISILERFPGDHRSAAVQFMLEAVRSDSPAVAPYGESWDDVERAYAWGLLLQGRVTDVARLLPEDSEKSLMDATLLLAPIFRDDWVTASAGWARVPVEIRGRPHSCFVEAMLNIIGHRYDIAESLLRRAVTDSQRIGFGLKPAYEVFAGYVLLATGEIDRARELLVSVAATTSNSGQRAYWEWAQCMLGLTELRRGNAAEAEELLTIALESMQRSQRNLLAPLAAVALAEARFRLGDLDGSHESAEFAYRVAEELGNFAVLNWGLRQFEDVRLREIQRNRADTRWRRLFVTSARPTHAVPNQHDQVETVLFLQSFGRDRDLMINGVPGKIGRIKLLELVACVAQYPHGIDRRQLQDLLFPDSSPANGANHFRQITHRLRQQTGVTLARDGSVLRFPDDVHIVTADAEFERILASASGQPFDERIEGLESGLAMITGEYLADSRLDWVETRRRHLELICEEAQIALATLYLNAGNFAEARTLCEAVLESNPYSDPAYRIRVGIERKYGTESSVMAIYKRAQTALAELGLAPGDARRLLEQRNEPD